jgi:hypothetical protein
MKMRTPITVILTMMSLQANAQLAVSLGLRKATGQKEIVPLGIKNHFASKIESARAVVLLLDESGKVAAQSMAWVIGGRNTNGLAAHSTNIFNFVLQASKPFTTTTSRPKWGD